MSRAVNVATQLRMIEAVNQGDLDVLREIFTADVVDHDAAPDQGPGPDGYVNFFRRFREAFPDLHVTIEHITGDEDCIAIAVRVTGTHRGLHMGVAPTEHSNRRSRHANRTLQQKRKDSRTLGQL